MADLILNNVSKFFGQTAVINSVSLHVEDGEFVVFVGPSGCGKSTLLRLITGLESVSTGQIIIGDRDATHLKPSRREVSMVFQSYALFPHLTVFDNIGFGLKLAKMPKAEIESKVKHVASVLRVEDLLDRKPRQLSGGQRQRVAIGRSIIRNPKVFLFDEPLSNLDAALRVVMRLEITRLHQQLASTMIYVTHDQTEAMTLADRIVVLNEGQIEQVGTPLDLYERPANLFVAGFIGSPAMNFIQANPIPDGTRRILELSTLRFELPHNLANSSDHITIGIRPEHVNVVQANDSMPQARVEVVEKLGVETILYLKADIADELLTIRAEPTVSCTVGDTVGLDLNAQFLQFFDSCGQRFDLAEKIETR